MPQNKFCVHPKVYSFGTSFLTGIDHACKVKSTGKGITIDNVNVMEQSQEGRSRGMKNSIAMHGAEDSLTLSEHLAMLRALRDMAVRSGNISAAINAEIARGKAAGLYVSKAVVGAAVYGRDESSRVVFEYPDNGRREVGGNRVIFDFGDDGRCVKEVA